jgi:glutamyl-tRNA synthetase
MTAPRVRFAPSPTGYLHVGGARTALFNWLYARRTGGVFVLRIEDTDVGRSSSEMVDGILEGLTWLGLDWDEGPRVGGPHGPYFQSQRLERYREMGERLVREGHGYYCYCTAEGRGTAAADSAPAGSSTSASSHGASSGGWSAGSSAPGATSVAGVPASSQGTASTGCSPGSSVPGSTQIAGPGKDEEEGDSPRGETWTYDRRCLRLTPEEIAAREKAGMPRAIRFKVPEGTTSFHDLVHGDIVFDNANIEDFVALRSDGHPTYHLSVVADDIDMAITHVVRGDDHISNTPKQVLLYRAFGVPVPQFAHVPLILGPDKRRLSKRHGATSVMEYEHQGYAPEAMVNFLALLGWSPGTNQELFGRDELVGAFSIEGISLSNAVFNPEKLDWFSAQHILAMPAEDLARRIEPLLCAAGWWREAWSDEGGVGRDWLRKAIELIKPRAKRLTDFVEKGRPYFVDEVELDPEAVKKHLTAPGTVDTLEALRAMFAATAAFDAQPLEAALRTLAEERGVKAGALIHPTRVAVTGQAVSPSLFDVLALLGRDRTIARIDACIRFLKNAAN